MEWLLIIALGVWVWLQNQRLNSLARRIQELEWRLGLPRAAAPKPEARPEYEPAPANAEPEPLLLDTPLPEASNDSEDFPAPQPEPARPAPILNLVEPAPAQAGPKFSFEQWLAQHGLAWMGGGALALGAALLVAFAAQQGFFTPAMRLFAAAALGLALIAASEFLRRRTVHAEVGALLAGAGAAALYVTIWAACGLYNFIGAASAAVLLTLVSALLIALSRLHGQPLGALAIGAGLLAPALTNAGAWPSLALTLFIAFVASAGFTLAALQRWAWTALIALAGLYVWFAASLADGANGRALALLCLASLGAAAIALRGAIPQAESGERLSWRQTTQAGPTLAICVASVLMLWAWASAAPIATGSPAGPALAALLQAGLAALAIRRKLVHPTAFATAAGAALVGMLLYASARTELVRGGLELFVWPLAIAAGLIIAALGARPHRRGRTLIAAAGAICAALLIILAAFARPVWAAPEVWGVLLAGAALLLGAAERTARTVAEPRQNWAVDAWVYGAAALALIAMESLAPLLLRPAAQAGLGFAFAALAAWRGWRGAGLAALGAASLAFVHAAAPDFAGPVIAGETPLAQALLGIAAAAALVFGAADVMKRKAHAPNVADALHSAFVLLVLLGSFLALRWFGAGGAGAALDPFTENALRALMLMAAGYVTLPRGQDWTLLARLRGHVFLGCGLIMALLSAALVFHPWWGEAPAALSGAPLFNANLIALLAPAGFSFAAARLAYRSERFAARVYAGACALFGLIWAVSEIRFLTHGADMIGAEVGLLEGNAYGLLFLATAVLIAIVAHARVDGGPFSQDLSAVTRASAFAGLGVAAFILLVTRNAWWGGQNPALSGDIITAFAVLAQAGASLLALLLARALAPGPKQDAARFTAGAAAALFALAFGHDAIRWLHHFGAMDDAPSGLIGLEGFAHALWPLGLCVGAAELTRRLARPFLADLQTIWPYAVWPALVWAALGLWALFNPWWGAAPASAATIFSALLGLGAFFVAGWLSLRARALASLPAPNWFGHAALLAAVGHGFVALSLTIRRLFHGADMGADNAGSSLETWSYSAAWALFAALVWMLGSRRGAAPLRRVGLALLLVVTAKVLVFDTATLDGVIRAASVIGAGLVLTAVALAARRLGGTRTPRQM